MWENIFYVQFYLRDIMHFLNIPFFEIVLILLDILNNYFQTSLSFSSNCLYKLDHHKDNFQMKFLY